MFIRWAVFYILLLLPLQLFSADDTNETDSNETTFSIAPIVTYLLSENKELGRIMPLGDSITWDWYYGDNRSDSKRHAYRNHLWNKLKDHYYHMDFVGSRHNGDAVSPSFDGDNEGRTGWRAYQIRDNIYSWLKKNPADTVLLHVGTNDSVSVSPETAVYHVDQILDEIAKFGKDRSMKIKVILAKIIKFPQEASWVSSFNKQLGDMAQDHKDAGEEIIVVDMEKGAGLDYSKDLIDGIHPTNCGYEKMANVWYQALTGKTAPALTSCH